MSASSSPSSKPSSNPGDTYIGSVISLTSKYEIRYEGVLYHINSQDSTIGLKNVRSYGTEGRKSDGPQIPPSDKLYEFILFRGSDIKDLQVKSSPSARTDEQVFSDPAIIQSQHSDPLSTSPAPSLGGRTESAQGQTTPGWQSTPALTSRAYSSAQPPYPSINHAGSTNLSRATQTAGPSFPVPLYWRGYNGTSVNISHAPQQSFPFQSPSMVSPPLPVQNQMQVSGVWTSDMSHVPQQSFPFQSQSMVSSPLPVQNQMQVSGVWTSDMSHVPQQSFPFQSQSMVSPLPVHNQMQVSEVWTSPITGLGNTSDSPIMGVTNASTPITPIPSIASNLLHPKFPPSLSPVQYSTSPDMPSTTSSTMISPSSHVDTNPFPWLSQGISTAGAQNAVKYVPNPEPVLSTQANPCPASSFAATNLSSFLSPLPPLLTPNQLAQSRSLAVPCAPNVYPDQNGTAIMTTIPPASPPLLPTPATQGMIAISPLLSAPASQEPLLPLPGTVQQGNYLTTQFTEEFDFEAMNEKFKKDEVWGYLGMAKQRDKIDSEGDNATDQSIEVKENPGAVPNFDPKPAYKKDEFFDTISCNSLARGRNMQNHNHFPERMRRDAETFGNSHQRYNLGYGGYGGGRGDMYHGSHNRGRGGYGYRGRGRGYPPF